MSLVLTVQIVSLNGKTERKGLCFLGQEADEPEILISVDNDRG